MNLNLGWIREAIPRGPKEVRSSYAFVLGVTWAVFHIYAGIQHVDILRLVHVHVCVAVSMTFAVKPTKISRLPTNISRIVDTVLVITPLGILVYLLDQQSRLVTRIPQVDPVTSLDMVLGTILIILVLEGARRITGIVLPLIGAFFIFYAYFGSYFPSIIYHSGMDFDRMIDLMFLDDRAIFGIPAKVSARYVFLFVLFGAVLIQSGADKLFLELAKSIGGGFKGGAAKIAVMTSATMASINGSAVANTVSTGSITIPLMMESGYDDESSGAIESLSSTGGQLMPPVMGAAAFVLAELSGTPYLELIIYAVIPSLLFYLAVFMSVHLEALKQDVPAIPESELPPVTSAAKSAAYLAIPIVGLLYILYTTRNIELAAGITVLLTFATIQLHPETRMGPVECLRACREGAEMVLAAALPCAVAGIVIGVVFFSGIGARLTSVILSLTGGSLILTLLLVAVVSIILGMGMPTTGAYITVAVLAVPTLIELGINPLAAHMFGLYFAVFSMVTPPIAIAAFAAASISGSNPMETGVRAFLLGLPAYVVPFLFILHPELLLQSGTIIDIAQWTAAAVLIIALISVAGTGYLFDNLLWIERVIIPIGCLLMVFFPSYFWVGLAISALGLSNQICIKLGIDNPLNISRPF